MLNYFVPEKESSYFKMHDQYFPKKARTSCLPTISMFSNSVQLISCFNIHSLSSSCVPIVRVYSCLCSFSLYLVKALLARRLYVV